MVSSNTESGITVTYQDADGTLDFTLELSIKIQQEMQPPPLH